MEDDFVSGLEPKRDGTKNCRNLKRTHIIWSGLVAETKSARKANQIGKKLSLLWNREERIEKSLFYSTWL